MRIEDAETLKPFLPAGLLPDALVAGGYAADPAKAEDVDLWVIGVVDFDAVEAKIRGYLMANHLLTEGPLLRDAEREWQRELSADLGDIIPYEDHPGVFRVVVDHIKSGVRRPDGRLLLLQIILSAQTSFLGLLRTFDISTHQIGYSLLKPESPIRAATYTVPFEQPRVVNIERPHATLKRVERIFPRYGFSLLEEDRQRLLEATGEETWTEAA